MMRSKIECYTTKCTGNHKLFNQTTIPNYLCLYSKTNKTPPKQMLLISVLKMLKNKAKNTLKQKRGNVTVVSKHQNTSVSKRYTHLYF